MHTRRRIANFLQGGGPAHLGTSLGICPALLPNSPQKTIGENYWLALECTRRHVGAGRLLRPLPAVQVPPQKSAVVA